MSVYIKNPQFSKVALGVKGLKRLSMNVLHSMYINVYTVGVHREDNTFLDPITLDLCTRLIQKTNNDVARRLI